MISSKGLCVASALTSLRLVQRSRNISESISNSFNELSELRPPKDCARPLRVYGTVGRKIQWLYYVTFLRPILANSRHYGSRRNEYTFLRSKLDSSAIKNTFGLFTRMSYHRNIFAPRVRERGIKSRRARTVKSVTARWRLYATPSAQDVTRDTRLCLVALSENLKNRARMKNNGTEDARARDPRLCLAHALPLRRRRKHIAYFPVWSESEGKIRSIEYR